MLTPCYSNKTIDRCRAYRQIEGSHHPKISPTPTQLAVNNRLRAPESHESIQATTSATLSVFVRALTRYTLSAGLLLKPFFLRWAPDAQRLSPIPIYRHSQQTIFSRLSAKENAFLCTRDTSPSSCATAWEYENLNPTARMVLLLSNSRFRQLQRLTAVDWKSLENSYYSTTPTGKYATQSIVH